MSIKQCRQSVLSHPRSARAIRHSRLAVASFLAHVSMTSEQGGRNSDTFYLFILKYVYGNYYLFVFLFIYIFFVITGIYCFVFWLCMYFIALTVQHNTKQTKNSDTFLTGMHVAVITRDRFWADFAHLKQAYWKTKLRSYWWCKQMRIWTQVTERAKLHVKHFPW